MRRLNTTNACVLGLVALLALGCGSDDKPATDTTNTDNDGDAAPPADTSAPGPGETSAPDETTPPDSSSPTPSPTGDLGDPVLPDVDPDTELSELDEDQLAEVCEAYVETSIAVSANLAELCPAQGLFQAVQSEEVTDDESYQSTCAVQVEACETQVTAAQADSPAERCETAGECGASVQDFNDCNAQIAALNRLVLAPLTNQDVPECSDTTQSAANSVALTLGIQVSLGLAAVTNETGGNPTDTDGPCARISEACPELGVALGAFSELGGQLQ